MEWTTRIRERIGRWLLREELEYIFANEEYTRKEVSRLRHELELADSLGKVYARAELASKREEVIRAFAAVDRDDPLLVAVRALADSTADEAAQLAIAPEMTRQPGEAAHAAGGAYWIALLSERMRDAWRQAHTSIEHRQ